MTNILGIHIGHDASASLIIDGRIAASIAEERFHTHKALFRNALNAVEHCLIEARLSFEEIDAIAYSGHINEQRLKTMFAIDDQLLERITGLDYKQKFLLRTKDFLKSYWAKNIKSLPSILKLSYPVTPKFILLDTIKKSRCSAYYTSGNSQKTLVVTADGAGDDGNSLTVWLAEKGSMKLLKEYSTEYSFGYFYSAVTEALGWWSEMVRAQSWDLHLTAIQRLFLKRSYHG